MKIVFVNQSAGYLTTDLIEKFHNENYETILLTGTSGIENKIPFCRIDKIPSYNNKTIFTRIITWLASSIVIFFKILFKYKNDKIVFYSNPPTNVFIHLFLPKLNFGYILFDIYPDLIRDSFQQNKFVDYILNIWKNANRRAFNKANYLIYISHGMYKPLLNYTNGTKLNYVGLWSSLLNIKAGLEVSNLSRNYKTKDELLLVYSGNLGVHHPIEKILEIAKKVKNENIKFIICGSGSKYKLLESEIENLHLEHVKLIPKLPQNDYLDLINSADFMFVTNSITASNLSIPSKIFDILALGKPIIALCHEHSDLFEIIEKYEIGFNIDLSKFDTSIISHDLRKTIPAFMLNIDKFNIAYNSNYQLQKLFNIIN